MKPNFKKMVEAFKKSGKTIWLIEHQSVVKYREPFQETPYLIQIDSIGNLENYLSDPEIKTT